MTNLRFAGGSTWRNTWVQASAEASRIIVIKHEEEAVERKRALNMEVPIQQQTAPTMCGTAHLGAI